MRRPLLIGRKVVRLTTTGAPSAATLSEAARHRFEQICSVRVSAATRHPIPFRAFAMYKIRARRGNTVLELSDSTLRASIDGMLFGTVEIPARERQHLWQRITSISVPVSLGDGRFGMGGTSSDVEISHGMTRLGASWWMGPPKEWNELASVFDWLAALLPRDITSRYDFACGGE